MTSDRDQSGALSDGEHEQLVKLAARWRANVRRKNATAILDSLGLAGGEASAGPGSPECMAACLAYDLEDANNQLLALELGISDATLALLLAEKDIACAVLIAEKNERISELERKVLELESQLQLAQA